MKHSRLRGDEFGLQVCSAILAVALQAAVALDIAPTAIAQAPAKRPTPQKIANPLNDLLDEAQRNIDSNNFEAAIAPLQKFIAEKPDVAFAHFQLGYIYTALKRTDEARAEYERAIALDPKMPEAYLNLGVLLLDKQQYAAAVAPLTKAVELLPAQSRPRSLLAVAQDRSGDQEAAARSPTWTCAEANQPRPRQDFVTRWKFARTRRRSCEGWRRAWRRKTSRKVRSYIVSTWP